MKSIKLTTIAKELAKLIVEASFNLPADIISALIKAREIETSPTAVKILDCILENARLAPVEKLPLCQDCGRVYINLAIGPGICIEQSQLLEAKVNDEVAKAYQQNYLRKSIVDDPLFERKNTQGNTPALLSMEPSSQPGLTIEVNLKGGGSENCSYLFMLNPSTRPQDIVKLATRTVRENVTKCCPPVIIGLGIGSGASGAAVLARKASFRNLNKRNAHPQYRRMEQEILEAVNSLGIGPQGLGGKTTALACNIEYAPCHMATLPVALFLGCHSLRRASSNISPPHMS
ncbi:MAG: fumarate hydratase [Actinomycetota bacterium]|nr:fumarate hydratase [Actinomycetota bacterium]